MNTTTPREANTLGADEDDPVLRMSGLSVRFGTEEGGVRAVSGVDIDVRPAEVVAVVGESGSGKSVSAMSVLGLTPRGSVVEGSVELSGQQLLGLDERRLRGIRGKDIAMVFQEPMTSLNPVFTVGAQLREVLTRHMGLSRGAAHQRARELLSLVGIDDAERRLRGYPHQLSGGQRQRVMIAMAVACDPKLLIADEPTTALDVTVQAEILELLRDLKDRLRTAILLITHDMGVVADIAERVLVMYRGEIVESGDTRQVLTSPRHPYTERLLRAVPRLGAPSAARTPDSVEQRPGSSPAGAAETGHDSGAAEEPQREERESPILDVRDLVVDYGNVRAVSGVSLRLGPGEILGLVGESGSGKSTVGRCAAGLARPTSGTVEIRGRDISGLSRRRMRPLRRDFQIVFQDPASSLNPRMSIGDSISEPIHRNGLARGRQLDDRVAELLESVFLEPEMRHRFPHELSGGQRQRVSIARALAPEPSLLIADEPTSALDVSVQAEVLELITSLQRRLQFACLFISHDLAVVELLASRVAVMRSGEIVEAGPTGKVLHTPDHPYTRALVAAAPVPDPEEQRRRRTAEK